jgi:hypothetical protein
MDAAATGSSPGKVGRPEFVGVMEVEAGAHLAAQRRWMVFIRPAGEAAEIQQLRAQVRTLTRYARELEDELAQRPSRSAQPVTDVVQP